MSGLVFERVGNRVRYGLWYLHEKGEANMPKDKPKPEPKKPPKGGKKKGK